MNTWDLLNSESKMYLQGFDVDELARRIGRCVPETDQAYAITAEEVMNYIENLNERLALTKEILQKMEESRDLWRQQATEAQQTLENILARLSRGEP